MHLEKKKKLEWIYEKPEYNYDYFHCDLFIFHYFLNLLF